jgi:hypothetical protein
MFWACCEACEQLYAVGELDLNDALTKTVP